MKRETTMANAKRKYELRKITVRVRADIDLEPKLDYLKQFPGGISGWVQRQLDKLKLDNKALRTLKKVAP